MLAGLMAILKLISLLAGLWSAVNGLALKQKIDTYSEQVQLVASGTADAVTADAPSLFDWGATILPGLLAVGSWAATGWFGKDSQLAKLLETVQVLSRVITPPAPLPSPGPVPGPLPNITPGTVTPSAATPVVADSSSIQTITAIAVLLRSSGGFLEPLAVALMKAISVRGVPRGFSGTLHYADGDYSIISHPGSAFVRRAVDPGDDSGDASDDDLGPANTPAPKPSRN